MDFMDSTAPIYNIGIIAHVDAGKTSLSEQLLSVAGAIRTAGAVDHGTAKTDFLSVERRRGISVRSACISFAYQGCNINLVDTPGHVDFSGEVERALSILDAAVIVVSASEGVQSHTSLLLRTLKKLNMPTMIVINKIDQAGSSSAKVLSQLRQELSAELVITEELMHEGTELCSVLPRSLSDPVFAEEFALAAALGDEYFAELFFDTENPSTEIAAVFHKENIFKNLKPNSVHLPSDSLAHSMVSAFKKSMKELKLYPVLFTSAKYSIGITELLDAIPALLPDSTCRQTEELSGMVFQLEHDPCMGKMAYIRLFGGTLQNRSVLPLFKSSSDPEKISQIRKIFGERTEDTGILHAGDIGAIYGISSIHNGDIVGKLPPEHIFSLTVPLLMVKLLPPDAGTIPAVKKAMEELSDEDPLLNFTYNNETREMHVSITGMIQLEIITELIKGRYGFTVNFSEPTVIYKETPRIKASGFEAYTMPKPCWAVLELLIEPLPRGSGLKFQSLIKDNSIPYRYQHHIETSLFDTFRQGIYGWEVTDALVSLINGEHHNVHTHPLDFFVATPVAALRALENAGSCLLEPRLRVELTAPEEHLGRMIRDILDMRGEFESPVTANGECRIEAILPTSSSLYYPVTFRSYTSGKGLYTSEFYDYKECQEVFTAILPRKTVNPLDRSKWILYARNAL